MTHAKTQTVKPAAPIADKKEGASVTPLSVVGTHSTQPGLTGDGAASTAGLKSSPGGQNSGGTSG